MVLASGCFDGIHAGHVAYLRSAASLCEPGEYLVVAVASDDYMRLVKGRLPKWTQSERVDAIGALTCVDVVVVHGVLGACEAIRVVQPRLFVKGGDWHRKGLPPDDVKACQDVGAAQVFVEEEDIPHTSEIRH